MTDFEDDTPSPIENQEVTHFTVSITELPAAGSVGIIARVRPRDRDTINKAAQLLGFRQADFIRTSVIQAARQVVSELSKKIVEEPT